MLQRGKFFEELLHELAQVELLKVDVSCPIEQHSCIQNFVQLHDAWLSLATAYINLLQDFRDEQALANLSAKETLASFVKSDVYQAALAAQHAVIVRKRRRAHLDGLKRRRKDVDNSGQKRFRGFQGLRPTCRPKNTLNIKNIKNVINT